MATTEREPRFPTTGPRDVSYERYRYDTTTDGEKLIYDDRVPNAWIQAIWTLSLEQWR